MSNNLFLSPRPRSRWETNRYLRNRAVILLFGLGMICWLFIWNFRVSNKYEEMKKLEDEIASLYQKQGSMKAEIDASKNQLEEAQREKENWKEKSYLLEKKLKEISDAQGVVSKDQSAIVSVILPLYDANTSELLYFITNLNWTTNHFDVTVELFFIVFLDDQTLPSHNPITINNGIIIHIIGFPLSSTESFYNTAVEYTKGKYLYFLPSLQSLNLLTKGDSVSLSRMIMQLEQDSDIGMLGSSLLYIKEDNGTEHYIHSAGIGVASISDTQVDLYHRFKGYDAQSNLVSNDNKREVLASNLSISKRKNGLIAISKMGSVISKELFKKVGGFDPSLDKLPLWQDTDFSLRLLKAGRNLRIDSSRIVIMPQNFESKLAEFMQTTSLANEQSFMMDAENAKDDFHQKWFSFINDKLLPQPLINLTLMWDLYCGCTGLNIEAISYLVPLEQLVPVSAVAGEGCFCKGFEDAVHESLDRIRKRKFDEVSVFVSHKPADRYPKFPYRGLVNIPERPKYVIGRSMTETVPVPPSWVKSCNENVDEVWVPSQFHVDSFAEGGVNRSKLFRIPEATDTYLWDPEVIKKLPVPELNSKDFNFLSVFKWEKRKGWDILLRAYFEEFTFDEPVALYIHTYLYGDQFNARNERKIYGIAHDFAKEAGFKMTLPKFKILTTELPARKMPQLYKNFDAFVLPTRGEGWGLPIMEAMAMGLPTIATNWSGPTEFMNTENSYPIPIDGLESVVTGGKEQWAKPSIEELRKLMRFVFTNRKEAASKGKRARHDIVANYSQEAVAQLVVNRLKQIEETLANKKIPK